MTAMTKKKLSSTVKSRYLKTDKEDKGKILDEFCQNTGYIENMRSGYCKPAMTTIEPETGAENPEKRFTAVK